MINTGFELDDPGISANGLITFAPHQYTPTEDMTDYWTGNVITIKSSEPGIQEYELIIRSRYAYPLLGYDNGRIIGNITWEM